MIIRFIYKWFIDIRDSFSKMTLRNGTKKINLSPLCSLYALCLAPVIASAYTYQDMCRIISITQSYAIRV